MMNNSVLPRPGDVVLGSQSLPLDAAVLGGFEKLKQKLTHTECEQEKLNLLCLALQYGQPGEHLLFEVLNDAAIELKFQAYDLLWQYGDLHTKQEMVRYFVSYTSEYELVGDRFSYLDRNFPNRNKIII